MEVKSLERTDFEVLTECFLKAFDDYFVKMPGQSDYYRRRWSAARVRFDLSYGMFDKDKLVGFIINGVDYRNKHLTAHNVGTGVIPEYRGNRIVKSIYDFALKDLQKNGVTRCSLEVIKDNTVAIKAYESIGFEIIKNYKCFNGNFLPTKNLPADLQEFTNADRKRKGLDNQDWYSWENHGSALTAENYRWFYVLEKGIPVSYFIIDPSTTYLAQFDLIMDKKDGWDLLFSAIHSISSKVKINNVDERLKDKLDYLRSLNIPNVIDQYEMQLDLKS